MRKNIVKLSKLVTKFIESNNTAPEKVFYQIKTNSSLNFLKELLSPRDIVILCFIVTLIKNGKYTEGIEYVMDQFLFSYSIVEFEGRANNYECTICDGEGSIGCQTCYGDGYNDCSECDGSGVINCLTCDGEGVDADGDDCHTCDGVGTNNCRDCDGDGRIECDDCDGSGNYECPECNGDGYINTDEHIPFSIIRYLAWNPKFREKLRQLSDSKKNIGQNYKLDNNFSMEIKHYRFDHHQESETKEIESEYEHGTYVGGIEENPNISIYGNDIWIADPTPDEKFKKSV